MEVEYIIPIIDIPCENVDYTVKYAQAEKDYIKWFFEFDPMIALPDTIFSNQNNHIC